MKWQDIQTKYKARKPPQVESWSHQWRKQADYVDALLTGFARGHGAFDSAVFDLEGSRHAVGAAYRDAFMTFGYGAGGSKADSEYWKSVCALLGAALNDPELVATCSGGKTLGAKVQKNKTYASAKGHDLRGLARHLATAARAQLPASQVEAAMTAMRDDFTKDGLRDPRVAFVAAHALFAHVAVLPAEEIPPACRAWLDGKPLDVPEGAVVSAPAGGEDPRVKIFEQFAEYFSDEAIAREKEELANKEPYSFDFRVFLPNDASDAATFLYLARQKLPAKWEAKVDPYVALWLGGKVTDAAIAKRRKEQQTANREYGKPREVRGYVIRKMAFDPAIRALHVGDPKTLAAYTGGGELRAFKPGKFFMDDWKKLLRYLAVAAKTKKVARADVEPAWFDFLSRKMTEHVPITYLLAIQSVITVQIGKGDPSTVGRDLQLVLTGV